MAHQHLVVTESLAERVCRHLNVDIKVCRNPFEDSVNGFNTQRLIKVAASIGFTSEHIIAQAHIRSVLEKQGNSFDNSGIDSDVPVLLALSRVTGLLLKNREAVLEGEVGVDEIAEPKHPQVACAKSKVDTDDEEHIISVSSIPN